MALVLIVPSSPVMREDMTDARADATIHIEAIPWELMQVGDSVLVHLSIERQSIMDALHSAQHSLGENPPHRFRLLMHYDCWEVGRINPTRYTPNEFAEFESWRKTHGIAEEAKRKPSGPMLH